MDETNSTPSMATGMAKRAFWFAIIGAVLGALCRLDFLGVGAQGLLALLALPANLIAILFGGIALIRITHTDRKVVLMPGLGALLVGIYSNVMVVRWAEGDWVHAVRQSRQAHAESGVLAAAPMEPFVSRGASPKASINYTVPWFDDIPTLASKTRAEAEHLSGQDAAVLRAWAGHLEKLYASYTNTWAVSNELYSVDLLDPKLVTYFTDAEAVRRRGVANRFSSAWHEMDGALSRFANSFYEDLRLQGVSPERTQVETQALAAFMGRPDVASRIDALRVFCSVEHDVGSYYNYAASAVFDYARMLKQTPAAATVSLPRVDEQVGKVRELEQSAARARQEATAKLTG